VAPATTLPSHVSDFVAQRLKKATGMSLAAKELRTVYEDWCATHGYEPLAPTKFAAELKRLGYDKWKSCGLMALSRPAACRVASAGCSWLLSF
jgi:hypothetical protein